MIPVCHPGTAEPGDDLSTWVSITGQPVSLPVVLHVPVNTSPGVHEASYGNYELTYGVGTDTPACAVADTGGSGGVIALITVVLLVVVTVLLLGRRFRKFPGRKTGRG